MERESFEDEEVAKLLNQAFIPIKVDREERPDLDHFYMAACQSLTGRGGWPLTVFLTPDKKPFFAGTYFPKKGRLGQPGLIDILILISRKWISNRSRFEQAGNEILKVLASQLETTAPGDPGPELLTNCLNRLKKLFDPDFGGFGQAPKFPVPHHLLFLLRCWKRYNDAHALGIVEKTLRSMYCGGIYDHIGFGFARYSTDRQWLAPHFEKMLYDNAMLSIAYLEAFKLSRQRKIPPTRKLPVKYSLTCCGT